MTARLALLALLACGAAQAGRATAASTGMSSTTGAGWGRVMESAIMV